MSMTPVPPALTPRRIRPDTPVRNDLVSGSTRDVGARRVAVTAREWTGGGENAVSTLGGVPARLAQPLANGPWTVKPIRPRSAKVVATPMLTRRAGVVTRGEMRVAPAASTAATH